MAAALDAAAVESTDNEGATSSPWGTKALRKGAGSSGQNDVDLVGTASSALHEGHPACEKPKVETRN